MDNLTHSLIGVILSRAGFNRLAPQAGWLCVAAANVPDIDIVAAFGGPVAYLEYHRGWTHSFAFAPLMALLPVLLWRLLVRKPEQRRGKWPAVYAVSLLCVLSHDLLDWLNVYGVRLLSPFDETWLRLDLVHIIDLWLWAALLLGVLGPMLAKMVNAEIGARSGPGRAGAVFTLIVCLLYVGARWELHARAKAELDARRYGEEPVRRTAAFPTVANPASWVGVVESSADYRMFDLNLLAEFDPESGRIYYKPEASASIEAASKTHAAQVFLNFAQFPLWRITPAPQPDGGTVATLTDLRFGPPDEGRFQVRVLLNASGQPLESSFSFGTMGARGQP